MNNFQLNFQHNAFQESDENYHHLGRRANSLPSSSQEAWARGSTPRVPAKRTLFVQDVHRKSIAQRSKYPTDYSKTEVENRQWTLTLLSWRTMPGSRITSPSTWESVHVATRGHERQYSQVVYFVRVRMQLALVRSTGLLIRGTRNHQGHNYPPLPDGAALSDWHTWQDEA